MTESPRQEHASYGRGMRSYELGNPELDKRIRQLVANAGDAGNQDLLAEMIVTVLRLHRDRAPRGDLKLINTALKEMRYSLIVFGRHFEPKVTIFGSARIFPPDPNYGLSEEFGRLMAEKGWGVITGAGPGIMEAGAKGATPEHSYGVNIRLPFESDANPYLKPERTVNYKYFFTRKLTFVKESAAFALFPGGYGTLDEAFELFTLMQTGKSDLHPVVLMESPEENYWETLLAFLDGVLAARGLISPADLHLFSVVPDAEAAVAHILRFYANYHSQRFVDGRLVLRVHHEPTPEVLELLSEEFADLLVSGRIDVVDPSPQEVTDSDALDLVRLALNFDRHSFGRLRLLIDRLNDLVEAPDTVAPPAPFDEEQAERPW